MEKNNSVFKIAKKAHSLSQSPAPVSAGDDPRLLRRFLHRDLSPLLILILLVLAPLTFSNDKIPNFQPDVTTTLSLTVKPGYVAALRRSARYPAREWLRSGGLPRLASVFFPQITPLYFAKTPRAPPYCAEKKTGSPSMILD